MNHTCLVFDFSILVIDWQYWQRVNYELHQKIIELENQLGEKTEELTYAQDLNQTLITKERNSNTELQDARKALVTVCIYIIICGVVVL